MSFFTERVKGSPYFLPVGAVLCSLLWGSAFPAIRLSHRYFDTSVFANHMAFAGLRFTLAGFLVLLFLGKKYEHIKKCPKKGLLIVALFQVVFQYMLFYWGLSVAPAVLGAILVSTGSFWWVLLAPLVDKSESIKRSQLVALALGFLGVCICVMNKKGGGDNYLSSLFFVFSSLCGTIAVLFVRPMNKQVPSQFLAGASLFLGGLILVFLVPRTTMAFFSYFCWELSLLTLWLAFVSAAAFSLWFYLVTLFDVPRLSGYRMLIPICGVLESVIFLVDERLTWNVLAGGGLVLSGVFLLEKLKKKPT